MRDQSKCGCAIHNTSPGTSTYVDWVFWGVTPCQWVSRSRRFDRSQCVHVQGQTVGDKWLLLNCSTMQMKAIRPFGRHKPNQTASQPSNITVITYSRNVSAGVSNPRPQTDVILVTEWGRRNIRIGFLIYGITNVQSRGPRGSERLPTPGGNGRHHTNRVQNSGTAKRDGFT